MATEPKRMRWWLWAVLLAIGIGAGLGLIVDDQHDTSAPASQTQ